MQNEAPTAKKQSESDGNESTDRRRRVLEHLQGQSDRLSERELAARVAASDREADEDVSDETVREHHVALRHVDLPKVEAAGLVSWDESTGTVEPADDLDLSEPEIRQLFPDSWDDPTTVSQYERRQAALAALREMGGETTMTDLAAKVAAYEVDDDAPAAGDIDDIGVALHHHHLPTLEDAGLVEYDPASETVAYTGPTEPEGRDDADTSDRVQSPDRDGKAGAEPDARSN